jgi:hypothetical protein
VTNFYVFLNRNSRIWVDSDAAMGEAFVVSARDSLLISVQNAKGYHDVRDPRLVEADIGVNKALR